LPREVKITGFILKKQPLGEADELITFYTKERGKLRARAVSVKKSTSRMLGSLQPASLVSARLTGLGSLEKVIGAEVIQIFPRVVNEQERLKVYYWLSEVVLKATPDNAPDEAIYEFVFSVLNKLNSEEINQDEISELLSSSALKLADLLGYAVPKTIEERREMTPKELENYLLSYIEMQLERRINSNKLFA